MNDKKNITFSDYDCLYAYFKERLRGVQRLAVLGAGSVLRADDAAGVWVAEQLREAFEPGLHPRLLFCAGETAPENFSGKIRRFNPTHLLVADAADIGLRAGDIAEIRPEDVGGPTYCTHMLPLRVMISYLAEETGCAVTLLGIQYKTLAFDGAMSGEVRAAAAMLRDALIKIIKETDILNLSQGNKRQSEY